MPKVPIPIPVKTFNVFTQLVEVGPHNLIVVNLTYIDGHEESQTFENNMTGKRAARLFIDDFVRGQLGMPTTH